MRSGVRILHFLGGSTIDLFGTRAIAQTKMTISQRAKVDGVLCDVVCTGRFYDFFEKRGRWGLVLRQPIYEKDRLDPLDPSAKLALDQELLAHFPEGYRHLAYLQTRIGYTVKRGHAGLDGPEVEALYARGGRWWGVRRRSRSFPVQRRVGGGARGSPPPVRALVQGEGVRPSAARGRGFTVTRSINSANAASCSLVVSRVV